MYKKFLNQRKVGEKSYPRCHYTRKKGRWKPKFPYDSKALADSFIKERDLENYESYRCPVCHKWHIGYHKREE